MPYDYAKLLGLITEKFQTQARFSTAIGLSERSVSLKLNGKKGWKQQEIARACQLLGIQHDRIPDYFFTLKVQ